MQHSTQERVSFTMRRTSCASYPITTIREARKQVHAERIVCELSGSDHDGVISFDYHVDVAGHHTDVVLTISGSDELLVREVAQRLDEHYYGQPFYEEEVETSWKS